MSEPTATTPVKVILFEDRAEVMRRGTVELRRGAQWVALGGVTPYVDDRSVQARVVLDGGTEVTVLSARVRRRVQQQQAAGREEIEALERAARQAANATGAAEMALSRAQASESRARHLLQGWMTAMANVPRFASEEERRTEWRAAYDELARAASAALDEAARAQTQLARAEDEQQRAELRLSEGSAERPRQETLVELQLDARTAGPARIEITYRTPLALWRPEHLARLVTAEAQGGKTSHAASLEIVTWATAWQRTGEAWDDVEMCFSTARTARAATPPLMADDLLMARRKTDEEKKRVIVATREQQMQVAGLDRGTRTVDEMPGVDDGGEPLTLAPGGRVSLPSDGRPFRVEVLRLTLPAEVSRVLYPERAGAAHLRATATLTGKHPLLAGPVAVARDGGLVGRAQVDFVGVGEPFELGFGADESVRVRRTHSETRDTIPVIGTQRVRTSVTIYLSNLSAEPKRLQVTERIPVSEIDDVHVTLGDGPWKLDSDGMARLDLSLAPGSGETLTLQYELRAAAKVSLPF